MSDPNAVWAAYYAAQAQPYTYPAAVQPTLQSVTGQQAAQYAGLSRAAVTPQPCMLPLRPGDCPLAGPVAVNDLR